MYRTATFLIIHLFFSNSIFSQVPDWIWAKNAGAPGSGLDYGNSLEVNSLGDIFVTGVFENTIQFGTDILISGGHTDIYITKYDSGGNVVWAKHAGGKWSLWAYGVSTDNFGNCYVTGFFTDTVLFDSHQLISDPGLGIQPDVFLAKYDSAGNCLWARKGGGVGQDRAYAIKTDANGNSYITGYIEYTANFGNHTISTYGAADIFIAKYDSSGNVLWVRNAGSIENDYGNGISIDAAFNCYVTGSFRTQANFGAVSLVSDGYDDIFVASYDSAGNLLWVKQAGGNLVDMGNAISTDSVGNSYITGHFSSVAHFDIDSVLTYGADDIFVSKYDIFGNVQWVRHAGSLISDRGLAITQDENGYCYVSGHCASYSSFGNLIAQGINFGLFLVKYSPVGNELWLKYVSGISANTEGRGLSILDSNNIVITGVLNGACYFGNINIMSNGSYDMFVAKLGHSIIKGVSTLDDSNYHPRIFPNPVKQSLKIECNKFGIDRIEIYDILGKSVMSNIPIISNPAKVDVISIDISALQTGIYFMKINNDEEVYSEKFVIQ